MKITVNIRTGFDDGKMIADRVLLLLKKLDEIGIGAIDVELDMSEDEIKKIKDSVANIRTAPPLRERYGRLFGTDVYRVS